MKSLLLPWALDPAAEPAALPEQGQSRSRSGAGTGSRIWYLCTIVQNVGYTRTGMEFDRYSEEMHELLVCYNQLFDR